MRKLHPDLIAFFDQKLAGNGLAQQAIKAKDPRTLLVECAKACVGIKEKTGNNDGPIIELMQKTAGGSRGQAWCMYFVQSCIAYCELKTGKASHVHVSGHCLTVWSKAKPEHRVKRHPLPGAIAIWRHGQGTAGHTEIVMGADESTAKCVGGNTSGADGTGKVSREGNGVYYTSRSMQGFPAIKSRLLGMNLVGFIVPF